jgi:glutathione S-transferase
MKLYRFRYSPYARKVQMLLDLLGARYQVVEVPYSDRTELATITGGYIYVPVLVDDDGTVVVESRDICERLLARPSAEHLVPPGLAGPIWAYADFTDGPLEDILFRVASPAVRDSWESVGDRALYVFVKERKFGTGCIDAWQASRGALLGRAAKLLAPTLRTLEHGPFLFGAAPTLADAALYGQLAMLEGADPSLVTALSPALVEYARRVEAAADSSR